MLKVVQTHQVHNLAIAFLLLVQQTNQLVQEFQQKLVDLWVQSELQELLDRELESGMNEGFECLLGEELTQSQKDSNREEIVVSHGQGT